MANPSGEVKPTIKLTTRGKVVAGIGVLAATAAAAPPAANLAGNIIDRGLQVEQPGPMYDNPALVGGQGTVTTESGKKATVTMPELTPTSPMEALPKDQLPNADNGPGLHST